MFWLITIILSILFFTISILLISDGKIQKGTITTAQKFGLVLLLLTVITIPILNCIMGLFTLIVSLEHFGKN
jgi:hypothetical protein